MWAGMRTCDDTNGIKRGRADKKVAFLQIIGPRGGLKVLFGDGWGELAKVG
jgi:hypothetical protein